MCQLTRLTDGAKGLWRHPRNRSSEYNNIEYWTDLAKILEDAKFHGLFIADVLGHYGVYRGSGNIDAGLPGVAQFPISDPMWAFPRNECVCWGADMSQDYPWLPWLQSRRNSHLA